ncbi:MAG: alpha/beta hydrolase [Pseudomonadota bacterium]
MPVRPAPKAQLINTNGITLSYFDWEAASNADQPVLLFAHATGFHARLYDAIIEHFPQHRVISVDQRGHGRSTGEPITNWRPLIDDMLGLIDHLGLSGAVGVGHSMGAHVLLQTASENTQAFQQLVLFDPVVLEPEYYASSETFFTADNPHPTAKRKRDFASPEAMIERFTDRDPYNIFTPRVFEDYCRHGLLPAPDGKGYELACTPEVEASVYASSRTNSGILDAATTVETPTLVIRAKRLGIMDFKGSPTWPQLASTMPNGTDLDRSDRTHFHPFEDPDDAAKIIRSVL